MVAEKAASSTTSEVSASAWKGRTVSTLPPDPSDLHVLWAYSRYYDGC